MAGYGCIFIFAQQPLPAWRARFWGAGFAHPPVAPTRPHSARGTASSSRCPALRAATDALPTVFPFTRTMYTGAAVPPPSSAPSSSSGSPDTASSQGTVTGGAAGGGSLATLPWSDGVATTQSESVVGVNSQPPRCTRPEPVSLTKICAARGGTTLP